MAENKKFTTEELERITVLRNEYDKKIGDIGIAEVELMLTEKRLDEIKVHINTLKSEYMSCQEKESELVNELNKKYGAGTVDLISGEFIPAT